MRLLIEVPTWLGDAVMSSGCVYKLIEYYSPQQVIIFGSKISTSLFDEFEIIINDKNHRFKQFFTLPKVDIAISFRSSLYSKLLMKWISKKSYNFKKFNAHQVEQYSKYINSIIKQDSIYVPKLKFTPKKYLKPTIGINPGATYGSAKRWYPNEFAKVANELGKDFDIIIFGGPGEENIAYDIEKYLTIKNYKNLCGKLNIKQLCEYIGGLDLFITNDSGPMHIAAAYGVKIIALFGPTKADETSPYNTIYKIINKNLECSPCMKRECPLKHHNCMKLIGADEVINESYKILKEKHE